MIGELRAALAHPNVQAFLRVIRAGESSQDPSAYFTMFGGGRVDSLAAHPNIKNSAAGLTSTAAGAYQFLGRTWAECEKALDLPDFGPESQDLAAVFLINRRGALDDVIAGRLDVAIQKCAKEWASLPGSPYGQPTRTLAQAHATYAAYGGVLSTVAANTKERTVPLPAFVAAALPLIIEAIPKLAKVFGSGSQVAERNIKAAELVVEAVKGATGAMTEQDAVAKLKSDPAAVVAATSAVDGIWYELTEAGGGGIAGARAAAAEYLKPGAAGFWLNPAFWISLILLAFPTMLLVDVFYAHPESYVGELRTQIVTGVLMVIGMVAGYWIGTSASSARKTEMLGGK